MNNACTAGRGGSAMKKLRVRGPMVTFLSREGVIALRFLPGAGRASGPLRAIAAPLCRC